MHFIKNIRWTLFFLIVAVSIGAYSILVAYPPSKGKQGRAKAVASEPISAAEELNAVALYSMTCAACHGQRLEGGVGPSLVGIGSRIPPTKIERIAQRGKGKNKPVSMPPGLATPEEARVLARWLAAGPKLAVDAPETGQAK